MQNRVYVICIYTMVAADPWIKSDIFPVIFPGAMIFSR